jgi:Fe-Mn family superoxide dismutase
MNPTTTTTPHFSTGSRVRSPTGSPIGAAVEEKTQPAIHALPPLPYDVGALAPALSADTLATHHGQHHRIYVDNVNTLSRGTEFAHMTLEAIIAATVHSPEHMALYRNASQAWNHDFYWRSLRPNSTDILEQEFKLRVSAAFGSLSALKKQLAAAALEQFGAGWVWLVADDGRLRVITTANADAPLTMQQRPLLTIDLWEHAYYLDYRYRRADYVTAVLDRLMNWDFAAQNLRRAKLR